MQSWSELVEQAKSEGFSVQLVSGDVPTTGYMVALSGHEERVPVEAFTLDRLIRYVKAHFDALMEDNMFLGAWANEGHVYLDVSERIADRELAVEVGKLRGQLAIWDVVSSQEISTSPVSA